MGKRQNAAVCIPKREVAKYAKKYNIAASEIEIPCKIWLENGNTLTSETKSFLDTFLEEYYKIKSHNFYDSESLLKSAHNIWKALSSRIKEVGEEKSLNNLYNVAIQKFGKQNVIKYQTEGGKWTLRIAEPVLGTPTITYEQQEEQSDAFKEAEELANKIMADSKANMRKAKDFETSHTYEVKVNGKWQKVDTSVTKLVHGKKDLGSWGLPSSYVGNIVDTATREFFENGPESLDKLASFLTQSQLEVLKEDLNRLTDYFDNRFGKGKYRVLTSEFPIAGKYTETSNGRTVTKTIAGTMDMLVYDSKGNFYIFDMKTMRNNPDSEKLKGYYKQLSYYKSILESLYPEIKGKIKDMGLIRFDVNYPTPFSTKNLNGVIYNSNDNGLLEVIEDDKTIPLQEYPGFKIRLHLGLDSESQDFIIPVEIQSLKEKIQRIVASNPSKTTNDLEGSLQKLKTELEIKELKDKAFTKREREQQKKAWRDSTLLTSSEKLYLSNLVMNLASQIITDLKTSKAAKDSIFAYDNGSPIYSADTDFTQMSRQEIIEFIGLDKIFDVVKEKYFTPEMAVERGVEEDRLDAVDLIYDNFKALIEDGYAKMILLENYSVVRLKVGEFVTQEGYDDQMVEDNDGGRLEEQEREYYQLGQRQISAKAGLSTEIRRLFERLRLPAEDNTWHLPRFVDSNVAVNSILEWCNNCETMEEMEEVLESKLPNNSWVEPILNEIKNEPIRSMFFNNFRKDFTQYGITYIEFDGKGNPVVKNKIINTKDAATTAIDGIKASFSAGLVSNLIKTTDPLEGRGYVNKEEISKIKVLYKEVEKIFHDSYNQKRGYPGTVRKNAEIFASLLSRLGINLGTATLINTIRQDGNRKSWQATNTAKILEKVTYIINEMEKHTNTKEMWNPFIKDDNATSLYGEYASIVRILADSLQNAVESSTYQNGKMYYSYVVPSYMGKLIKNLKDVYHMSSDVDKFERFLDENYKYDAWFYNEGKWLNGWLERLENEPKAREVLDHKVQLSHLGTEYKELSELGYTMSLIHEYLNKGSKRSKDTAWYRLPILSNKPSSEFVRFFKDTTSNYKENLSEEFLKVATQEIVRIQNVIQQAAKSDAEPIVNYNINNEDLKALKPIIDKVASNKPLTHSDIVKDGKLVFTLGKPNGASFKFLEFLNQELIDNTELGKIVLDKINGKKVNESKFNTLFTEKLKSWMSFKFSEELAHWKELGMFDTNEITNKKGEVTESTFKYASDLHEITWEKAHTEAERVLGKNASNKDLVNYAKSIISKEIQTNLEKYMWNDTYATIEIIQLTATDLAYYENMNDFQKRYAQVHSPGMRMNIDATVSQDGKTVRVSDGKCRIVTIADYDIQSDVVANVEAIFNEKIAATQDRNARIELQVMRDNILKEFKKIKKITDGQAYSCPSSYRKKLVMMGKWNEEMETAYQRICDGNFNIDDLNIIWQPLKPFVYTQVKKYTGVNGRTAQRVPMQFKNSEYLILLADAIMRGAKKDNLLSSIMNFMESTHYNSEKHTIDTYKPNGIDTIQFASAVKSGLKGVIRLQDAPDGTSIEDYLKGKVKAVDKVDLEEDGEYSSEYVHTFDYADYAIQQEVPAHLIDHKQLMGSQSRILSISDFSAAALASKIEALGDITTEEAINEYQELIAKNIRLSYDTLIKELKLKGTRKERNEALADLLYETIIKDQRYGGDLLYACQIDPDSPTSEFMIPLNDPIQAVRVQQLLNSIIKSRINKQKVSGGPVVQVTANGLSEDLNIRFKKKNGELLLTYKKFCEEHKLEYSPKVESDSYRKYSKYVAENQGSFSHMECLLSVTSSDLKEALTIKKGDKRFDESRVNSMMTVDEAIKYKVIDEKMLDAIGYRIPTEDKYSMFPMKIVGFTTSAEETIILPKEITLLTGSDFDIDKIYVMLRTFVKTKHGFKLSTDERDETNNRIFDIQYELLRHPDTGVKMFNPGSFDVQKKAARIVTILKNNPNETYSHLKNLSIKELDALMENSANRNIIFSTSQVYYHRQNMVAGKLIGIFANNNTSHAFVSLPNQNVTLDFGEENGFTFNGVRIGTGSKLDNIVAQDGYTLISKTIAGFLAASVDAVKDPVLNFMNLNTFTSGVAMLLARLGFDTNSIALFLTQPIIEDATREYFKRNEDGYISTEDFIMSVLKDKGLTLEDIKTKETNISNNPFVIGQLEEGLTTKGGDLEFQIDSLLLFKKLASIAEHLNTLTFLTKFNSVSNAVGPTIADTLVMEERYNKFKHDVTNKIAPFSDSALDVIDRSPILKAFYDTTVNPEKGASALLFGGYFPQYNDKFKECLNKMRLFVKSSIDSKTLNKFTDFFNIYKASLSGFILGDFQTPEEARQYYIYDFPREFTQRKSSIEGLEHNELINIINYEAPSRSCPVPVLSAKTGSYSVDTQEKIKTSWTELLKSTDEKVRKLGRDLFIYNIYRNGFAFSPKTFLHLASTDVKLLMNIENEDRILSYVDVIDSLDPMNIEEGIDELNILIQFLRNNVNNRKLVPELTLSYGTTVANDKNKGELTISFNKKNLSGITNLITHSEPGTSLKHFAPVIWYKDELYVRDTNDSVDINQGSVTYTRTSPLGIENDFIELDATAESGSSVKTVISGKQLKRATSKKSTDTSVSNSSNDDVTVSNAEELENSLQRKLVEFVFSRATPKQATSLREDLGEEPNLTDAQLNVLKKFMGDNESVQKYKKQFEDILKKLNECRRRR